MNYQDAIEYINDKNKYGSRLGLHSIGRLLELLGNPHLELKCIHIGGTNGKGSTSSYISNILMESKYKVGLFTSPYIERFNERIQINGVDIPNEELGRITSLIKEKADIMVEEGLEHPTTFEIVTAIAFMYFRDENTDYVVLEVGLGGRYDSTNIIKDSLVSVITTLDYDHIDVLGDTLGEIAYQKAGIIKKNGIVVSYPQEKEALDVLKEVAKEQDAEFHLCPMENIRIKEKSELGSIFDYQYKNNNLENIKIQMVGEYQIYNATLAITTILILREKGLINVKDEEIFKGLNKTRWMGRLEVLKRNPTFVIDGAHNVQAINQLVKALDLFEYNRLILGLGILKDKDVSHMIELLGPKADIIITTEVNMPRKLPAEELGKALEEFNKNIYVEKDIKKAIDKAYELAEEGDLILFGGSLYLIGEVRTLVNHL